MLFGGVVLVLLGTLHVGLGLVALVRQEFLITTRSTPVLPIGDEALAVIQLLLGVVAVVTGVGLVRRPVGSDERHRAGLPPWFGASLSPAGITSRPDRLDPDTAAAQ